MRLHHYQTVFCQLLLVPCGLSVFVCYLLFGSPLSNPVKRYFLLSFMFFFGNWLKFSCTLSDWSVKGLTRFWFRDLIGLTLYSFPDGFINWIVLYFSFLISVFVAIVICVISPSLIRLITSTIQLYDWRICFLRMNA